MSRNFKIGGLVLILLVILFLLAKIFNISFLNRNQVCPPDKCKVYKTDVNGNSIDATFPKEAGRLHKDFIGTPPIGLPAGIPVDPKPLKILTSYMESVEANEGSNEPFHSQVTYSYITSQDATTLFGNFEKYLKDKGYNVNLDKASVDQPIYKLFGEKISAQTNQIITINIFRQNQFENIVSISFIVSDIAKSQ